MTQYINLITRHRARKNLAFLASGVLGALLLAFVIWGGVAEYNLHALSQSTQEAQQTVAALQAELQEKRHEAGFEDVQALIKESADMQRRMDEHRMLMQVVQKGDLGNLQGHALTLQTLATMTQTGVWLQGVEVSKAGQSMRITGTALNSAAVMQYAEQLNLAFKPMGTEFTSLDLSKEVWDGEGMPGAVNLNVIKFKLY